MASSAPPARTSPLVHVKRAFGWNLGSVVPSQRESATLAAAGVTEPAVQRYAAWRRSLLLVALVPALLVALLGPGLCPWQTTRSEAAHGPYRAR